MNIILTNPTFISTLMKFNAYCVYLQVIFLSNMTNLKGDTLLSNTNRGVTPKNHKCDLSWSSQHKPNVFTGRYGLELFDISV